MEAAFGVVAACEGELVRIDVDGSWVTGGSSLITSSTHWLATRVSMLFNELVGKSQKKLGD